MSDNEDVKCGWKTRADELSASLMQVAQERDAARASEARLRKEFVAFLGVSRCSNGCHPDDMTCATSRADAALAATDSGDWLAKHDEEVRADMEKAIEAQAESVRMYAVQVASLEAQLAAATNDAARAELRARDAVAALERVLPYAKAFWRVCETPGECITNAKALLAAAPDYDARLREVMGKVVVRARRVKAMNLGATGAWGVVFDGDDAVVIDEVLGVKS